MQKVPIDKRSEAAECMVFEAHSREQDPVHGCVHQISKLFHQISLAQQDLAMVKAQLAILKAQHFQQQIQQQQHASSLSELYNLHHSLTEFISIPDLAP
ncbi:hypothetical protein AMTR_s00067p00126920 [Amborella trichopoda]|uniref:LOB domain-containing protein n=1 Tax=Amborella trichopoda TaxID=13333 RepID=U5DEK8_AMBTC|nr:hypothetical protein AMTR_s00067p00126920 [Amborella trichopoda]